MEKQMSVEAIAWAFKKQIGDSIAKLILLALADYANDDGACWPTGDTLAAKAECSRRSLYNKFEELEQRGLLRKIQRRDSEGDLASNIYILNVRDLAPQDFEGVVHRVHKVVHGGHWGCAPGFTTVVHLGAHKPSLEPSLEEDSKNHSAPSGADLQDFFGNKRENRPQNEKDLVLRDGEVFISSTTVEELTNDFPGLPNARGRIKSAAVTWLEPIDVPRRMAVLRSHLAKQEQASLERAAAREQRNGMLKDVLTERNKLIKAQQESRAAAQAERDKPKQPCW
jgi:hypothetical protein